MKKSILCLPAAFLITACSTGPDYAGLDCDSMRALVSGQNSAASARGIELYNDRGVEETRQESGSPWAGRSKTNDDQNLRDERQAIREAYRRKGCTR